MLVFKMANNVLVTMRNWLCIWCEKEEEEAKMGPLFERLASVNYLFRF